ncbi:uncharacterized protein METZ01_LOCUS209228, partial [marine metagenome]
GQANSGGSDAFFMKYNSSGDKQWTRQFGTSSSDDASGVAVDSSGNIYITGGTQGGFGNYTNAGTWDIFLAKYNSNGVQQWVKQSGTSTEDNGNAVAIDSSDNIYITGRTSGGDLDGQTNSGRQDIFLIKYNSSGTKLWTKLLGGGQYAHEVALDIKIDSSDNIYLTGMTTGDLDGNTNANNNMGSNKNDFFVVKYNSDGVLQ